MRGIAARPTTFYNDAAAAIDFGSANKEHAPAVVRAYLGSDA